MRNLVEYPVTAAEIAECCRRQSKLTESDRVGDMTPLLLAMAADVVEAAAGMLEGIEARLTPDHGSPLQGDPIRYITPWDRATALVRAFQAVRAP